MATEPSGRADTGAVIDRTRRPSSLGVRAAASVAGILLLALVGWVAWNQGALVGLRWVDFDSPLTLAAFGFVAGIGAFFAPCAFALFPAYISYYLTTVGTNRESPGRSLALGLTCAAGSAAFFAIAGVAIALAGGVVSRYLIGMKPVVAIGVALLGLGLVADIRMPSMTLPFGRVGGRLPPAAGLFFYGFGYALASTGCTFADLRVDHRSAADERLRRSSAGDVRELRLGHGADDASHEPPRRAGRGKRAAPARGLDRLDQTGEWRRANPGRTLPWLLLHGRRDVAGSRSMGEDPCRECGMLRSESSFSLLSWDPR